MLSPALPPDSHLSGFHDLHVQDSPQTSEFMNPDALGDHSWPSASALPHLVSLKSLAMVGQEYVHKPKTMTLGEMSRTPAAPAALA